MLNTGSMSVDVRSIMVNTCTPRSIYHQWPTNNHLMVGWNLHHHLILKLEHMPTICSQEVVDDHHVIDQPMNHQISSHNMHPLRGGIKCKNIWYISFLLLTKTTLYNYILSNLPLRTSSCSMGSAASICW